MKPHILSIFLIASVCSVSLSAIDSSPAPNPVKITFYVSPSGNDSGDGTLDKPYKTLERAKLAVRSVKWQQMGSQIGNIDVMLRNGHYFNAQPIVFTENDSSNYGYKITYKNYPGENPVLVGGVPVTGWEKYKGHIY